MGLKDQLVADYKEAMKSKDTVKKNTVNMVRAAIKQHEVDQRVELEDDADIIRIICYHIEIGTAIISRVESADICKTWCRLIC